MSSCYAEIDGMPVAADIITVDTLPEIKEIIEDTKGYEKKLKAHRQLFRDLVHYDYLSKGYKEETLECLNQYVSSLIRQIDNDSLSDIFKCNINTLDLLEKNEPYNAVIYYLSHVINSLDGAKSPTTFVETNESFLIKLFTTGEDRYTEDEAKKRIALERNLIDLYDKLIDKAPLSFLLYRTRISVSSAISCVAEDLVDKLSIADDLTGK